MGVTRVLFVCGRNRLRSPTAERVFSDHADLEVASAGLSPDAEEPLTPELVRWADVILVMEETQRAKLARHFRPCLRGKRVACLDIPDEFAFMEPRLVELLRRRVPPLLPTGRNVSNAAGSGRHARKRKPRP